MATAAAATNIVQKRGQASSRKRNGWGTGTNRKEREGEREMLKSGEDITTYS